MSARFGSDQPPAFDRGRPPAGLRFAGTQPDPSARPPGPLELGTAPRGRVGRTRRGPAHGQPGGSRLPSLLVVFFVLLGAALVLPRLVSDTDRLVGEGSATASPSSAASQVALAPTGSPAASSPVTPVPIVLPTLAPPPTATPSPSIVPSSPPTPSPTPTPEPSPTQPPTPRPTPRPTGTPRPPAQEAVITLDDGQFVGSFAGRRSTRYRGRTASWVYGQGTGWHTMTASFKLRQQGELGRRASLTIVGLDGDNAGKNRMAIVLNGVTIFRGRNPLPNDVCCDDGPGSWGTAVFDFPAELLQRNNALAITNLEPDDCTRCPVYVMVDYVELTYRYRP